jgi:hypothetical protein
MPQYKRVKERQYTLHDSTTRKEIRRFQEFRECFQPGRCVVMSVLFPDNDVDGQSCPSCRRQNTGSTSEEVYWLVHCYIFNTQLWMMLC